MDGGSYALDTIDGDKLFIRGGIKLDLIDFDHVGRGVGNWGRTGSTRCGWRAGRAEDEMGSERTSEGDGMPISVPPRPRGGDTLDDGMAL